MLIRRHILMFLSRRPIDDMHQKPSAPALTFLLDGLLNQCKVNKIIEQVKKKL